MPRRDTCGACGDAHVLPGSYVFARPSQCTCGAGPYDAVTLHDACCDTVPCPFCQLLRRSAPWPLFTWNFRGASSRGR